MLCQRSLPQPGLCPSGVRARFKERRGAAHVSHLRIPFKGADSEQPCIRDVSCNNATVWHLCAPVAFIWHSQYHDYAARLEINAYG